MDYTPNFTLPADIDKRIPEIVTVLGATSVRGVSNADALRYFAHLGLTVGLMELRKRQAINAQNQQWAHQQSNQRVMIEESVIEDLLMHAVGITSFPAGEWDVPAQIGGYSVECC